MDLVSVVRDGRATYYVDPDDGKGPMVEFARIAVPAGFTPEATVLLGRNVMGATGIGGAPVAPVARSKPKALPAGKGKRHGRPPKGQDALYQIVASEVAAMSPTTVAAVAVALGWTSKQVSNAVQQARRHGLIELGADGWVPAS